MASGRQRGPAEGTAVVWESLWDCGAEARAVMWAVEMDPAAGFVCGVLPPRGV